MSDQEPEKKADDLLCNACGYSAPINTYEPTMSIYTDCRCPSCGSTDNEHNAAYAENLQKAWKKSQEKEKS